MKILVAAICAAAILAGGCASTETVKEAHGEGTARVYAQAYDRVFDAALDAGKARQLDVVESSRPSGRLIFSHGVTLWSWGERIAVFVKAVTPGTTEVEIVSKPVLAPLNFPPDWQRILLDEIDARLRAGK